MVEPLDCLDSPDYSTVTMQFGSRLGKTTAVQCWILNIARHNPRPTMWAEPDLPSLNRVFKRTWQMIDGTAGLDEKALPRHLRSNSELRFEDSVVYGAYSGSPSTAADYAAFHAVLNELDKFSHRRRLDADGEDAGEADFAELVTERTKGCADATIVKMSTPTVQGRSAIEQSRLEGDRRRYFVPCPHCNHYQNLKTGRTAAESGGLKWRKGADGHSDPAVALDSAWYECERCRRKILDEHRFDMINAGVWVRDGQSINSRGRITGKPLRAGNHASFGPLGTLNSLLPTITWGVIAAKYIRAKQDPTRKALRNFVNAWGGETWDTAPPTVKTSELAARLAGSHTRGVCPADTRFLTFAADVGIAGTELIYYWIAVAWNNEGVGAIVDWGRADGDTELWRANTAQYPLIDSLIRLTAAESGFDSGGGIDGDGAKVTERVYAMCRGRRHVTPLKGSSSSRGTDWYSEGFQRIGVSPGQLKSKRKRGLGDLLMVSTSVSQSWRESLIAGRIKPGEKGYVSVPAEVADQPDLYADFLEELTNDVLVEGSWRKRGPNEYGDALRYARVLAEKHTRGGKRWGRLPPLVRDHRLAKGQQKQQQSPERFSLLGGTDRPRLSPG